MHISTLKRLMGSLLMMLVFISFSFAQHNWCGTVHSEEVDQYNRENVKFMQERLAIRSGVPKYVPVAFTLVADDNGNGRLLEERVFDQLASLNAAYADQEITFFLKDFRYMDKTVVYNTPGSTGAELQMRINKDPNAINIFVTNSANSGDELPGVTTLAYWSPGPNFTFDWIVSRKADVNSLTSTMAHEVGHFFSLLHPHAGWDCLPYTEEDYGNPVNLNSTLCNGLPQREIELVDGSNCLTAGDRVCDTPADYNFAILHNGGAPCGNPTDIQDKNGATVVPMFNNYMGYYLNCSDFIFTQSQKNLMTSSYNGFRRQYIRTGEIPNITPVVDDVVYIYPENNGETEQFDNVTLDWEDVPGADKYLVLIDRFSSFTFAPQRYFVDDLSELNLTNLELDRTYFWKVWPYNASQTGHGFGETQRFKATISTSVPTIKAIESISVYPNPLANTDQLYVKLESNASFKAAIELVDVQGRKVAAYGNYSFGIGEQDAIDLSISNLPIGLYILKLTSENGVLTQKISIQQ